MLAETPPLPLWTLYFAFWASLGLTVLKIAELAFAAFRSARLDLRLTREAFFRLTDYGETLFFNSVLLAWNGPVLILDSKATLLKTDSATKAFPLRILQVGEKVKSTGGPFPDHFFHSSSPISHVAESDPQRVLYFCVQDKYEEASRNVVNDFRKRVLDYKQEVVSKLGSTSAEERSELSQEILRNINRLVDESLARMMELVQLEPGEYKLTLEVTFRNPKSRFRSDSTSTSSVAFSIGQDVRDQFRTNLQQTLRVSATNLILDQQTPVIYPDYSPSNFRSVND
jgi:hypothetical protein